MYTLRLFRTSSSEKSLDHATCSSTVRRKVDLVEQKVFSYLRLLLKLLAPVLGTATVLLGQQHLQFRMSSTVIFRSSPEERVQISRTSSAYELRLAAVFQVTVKRTFLRVKEHILERQGYFECVSFRNCWLPWLDPPLAASLAQTESSMRCFSSWSPDHSLKSRRLHCSTFKSPTLFAPCCGFACHGGKLQCGTKAVWSKTKTTDLHTGGPHSSSIAAKRGYFRYTFRAN